jgi:hypothetical protein
MMIEPTATDLAHAETRGNIDAAGDVAGDEFRTPGSAERKLARTEVRALGSFNRGAC